MNVFFWITLTLTFGYITAYRYDIVQGHALC